MTVNPARVKRNRYLRPILGVVLLSFLFASTGCNGGADGKTGSGAGDGGGAGGGGAGLDGAAGSDSLRVMVWDRGNSYPGTTVADNSTVRFIQEAVKSDTGLDITFAAVPRSGSDGKLNLMMAGDTAPDIVFAYSRTMLAVYAQMGGITPLGPAIDEYGQNITANFSDLLPTGYIDGEQYAVVARRSAPVASHMSFIRKDWLDILGEPVPGTKEELFRVLRLFKEKDPGGVGGALTPWAMGGTHDSEKGFISFVASYGDTNEETLCVYPDFYKALKPGSEDGYRALNGLYNEGLISKDFAVDTDMQNYKRDIVNGNAGFFVEDAYRPFGEGWFVALKENIPSAEFIAVNVFEGPDGIYRNQADPENGLYVMVPKTSAGKAAAAVKYLNWLADPDNAIRVLYTPEYEPDENGAPIKIDEDALIAGKYSSSAGDLAILGAKFDFMQGKRNIVRADMNNNPPGAVFFDEKYFSDFYDAVHNGLYVDIIPDVTTPMRRKYEAAISSALLSLAYKSIGAAPGEFDRVYGAEYKKLEQAGWSSVKAENLEYFQQSGK